MAVFKRLLLALDLNPEADHLLNRVFNFCDGEMDKVHVVHVVRNGMHDKYLSAVELEGSLSWCETRDSAAAHLGETLLRNNFVIARECMHIRTGEPAIEIKKLAEELGADLVIVGSHSKKGDWLELPGATTNCVLQGIRSDVMAVRV